ncbi:hypothetical protein [Streptomyces sp. NPDC088789]|uniref:hypothetical protein n=1 Tax=Streptomyces sp. NPDC088789 TaxID=3365899 RepID=UPI00381B8031
MLQCTAVRRLPARETVQQIFAAHEGPVHAAQFAAGHALCELAEGHEGRHAAFLWDCADLDAGRWLLWDVEGFEFVTLTWCAVPRQDRICELYARHPSVHSWAVTDPTRDELAAQVDAHPDRWKRRS